MTGMAVREQANCRRNECNREAQRWAWQCPEGRKLPATKVIMGHNDGHGSPVAVCPLGTSPAHRSMPIEAPG